MKPDSYFESYAEEAYSAYGETTDHKNYQGLPMPTWAEICQKPTIHQAWINAVRRVFAVLHVSDAETGEVYASEDEPYSATDKESQDG